MPEARRVLIVGGEVRVLGGKEEREGLGNDGEEGDEDFQEGMEDEDGDGDSDEEMKE